MLPWKGLLHRDKQRGHAGAPDARGRRTPTSWTLAGAEFHHLSRATRRSDPRGADHFHLAVGARAEPFGDAPRVRARAAVWRPFVVGILFSGTLATIEDARA